MSADRIEIRGLRAFGYHGVLGSERRNGQTFVVDVVLELDLSAAAESDDLERTVDYGTLTSALAAVVEGEPVDLIETLAQRLADVCLAAALVEAVEVVVRKPEAPVEASVDDVGVRIRRER